MIRHLWKLAFVLLPLSGWAHDEHDDGTYTSETLRQEIFGVLDSIELTLRSGYAPRFWKQELHEWELAVQIDVAKERAETMEEMTILDGQQIVRDFFATMKDYHVGVYMDAYHFAYLPFDIVGADGRYFITWIYRDLLGERQFPYEIGDELIEFDGRPTHEVVTEIAGQIVGGSNHATNMGLAEFYLLFRTPGQAMEVPVGAITVKIRSQETQEETTRQLAWYTYINDPTPQQKLHTSSIQERIQSGEVTLTKALEDKETAMELIRALFDKEARSVHHQNYEMAQKIKGHSEEISPWWLGSPKSILPELGEVVWESPSFWFPAYIFENEEGKKFGFLRIPDYIGWDGLAREIGDALNEMEEQGCEALVVDQMFNPGGFVMFEAGIGSMLSDSALVTAKHRINLNQIEAIFAAWDLEILESWFHTEDDVLEFFGESFMGYPMSMTVINLWKQYCQEIVEHYENGHHLTDLMHLSGVDHFNPNPDYHFGGPILFLINHMDFSAGDFFPAMLQDNARATLMGTRTAGAGGCVTGDYLPWNNLGVRAFSYTWTLAERPNGDPIEDLGVTPDVEYVLTPEDILNDCAPFVERIHEELANLITPPEPEDPDGSDLIPLDGV